MAQALVLRLAEAEGPALAWRRLSLCCRRKSQVYPQLKPRINGLPVSSPYIQRQGQQSVQGLLGLGCVDLSVEASREIHQQG